MEKTLNLFSRALNLSEDPDAPTRPPLNQTEFHSFLGPVGHVVQGSKLREAIYKSGIDPSFRYFLVFPIKLFIQLKDLLIDYTIYF